MAEIQRYGTASELWDWYYGEVAKLGLRRGDADGIFWVDGPIRRCQLVPLPNGRTREQLEELLTIIKQQMGVEPADDDD